ncbi:MAG: hypothetical protein EPO26_13385 [Chloroflexota bacterium]|nr:MAG: hypothetical protein EPO26_13385 [Chloroflexota bacterium]
MANLQLKSGAGWDVKAEYLGGAVTFYLVSQADKREYGKFASLGLKPTEWDRLVAWVNYQRTEEAVKGDV